MNNNQNNMPPYFQPSYIKPLYTYAVDSYVNMMMTQDVLSEYNYYINESNYYINQINTYQYTALKVENNQLCFNLSLNNYDFNARSNLENFEEVEKALTQYFQKQIKIIKDVEDLVKNKRLNPYIIYIPFFQIPTINYIVNYIFDIYDDRKSYIDNNINYFNFFTYTNYLKKRFTNVREDKFILEQIISNSLYDTSISIDTVEKDYFIWRFLLALTINKENKNYEYILNYIRHFFKTLRRIPQALILIENKYVSEEILYNKIIRPIFEPAGLNYCITITDGILESKSIDEIVYNKLFIHINYIPQNELNRDKLKKLLIKLLTQKSIDMGINKVAIQAQIIFTLDKPDSFLNDFLSSSKVLFIDSLENIKGKLKQDDETAIHKNIYENMDRFVTQLSAVNEAVPDSQYTYIDEYNIEKIKNERLPNLSSRYTLNDTNTFSSSNYIADNEIFKKMINNPDFVNFTMAYSNEKLELNSFHDSFEKIIPKEDRYKHTYITGKTGSGKSELLKTLIYRDILNEDCSVILLDIHGDLANDVTRLVKDKERVVLINPILEKDFTPTINLFETDDKSEDNIEQISQMISSVINSISIDDKLSGTMIDVLENCIPVLIRDKNRDFYDLKSFMKTINKENSNKKITMDEHLKSDDKKYNILIKLALNSKNEFEKDYFNNEFINISSATKNAVKRRLNKMLKNTLFSNLTNGKSTIDLEKEMNTKDKVIIFNIPKSKMLSTYTYYIKFIIGLIQIIALKRADIKDEKKRPHTHLYIDEFHNFITPTIEEILAESRKYKLFLTLAHQSVSQIKDSNLRDIILDNTNIKIIGKNSNKTLEMMNKTLNIKLENVEKLETGEFYIQSGTIDVIKIYNSDKLLNKQEQISDEQWQEHKQYQLENYYRSTIKEDVEEDEVKNEVDFDEVINEFIQAIKTQNLSDESCLKRIEQIEPKRFEEIESDFNFKKDGIKQPRIRQQEINIVFQLSFGLDKEIDNRKFTEILKEKDTMFKETETMSQNKKYRDKSQEKYYLI